MTVLVETFECTETASEPIDVCGEAAAIIDSLGLTGQKQLIQRDAASEPVQRCPYRQMTAEERFVYGIHCPSRVPLERYAAAPIPLRVLQIVAHAKSLGMFDEFIVWDKVSDAVKDPVLVAIAPGQEYSWMKTTWILARWGEVLHNFADLLKQAVAKKRADLLDQAARLASHSVLIAAEVDSLTDAQIAAMPADSQIGVSRPW